MEGKSLCTIKVAAGTHLELKDGTVVKFNSPMKLSLMWKEDVNPMIGNAIQIERFSDDGILMLVFTLDNKEACHENRSATIPEGSTVH